jgi:heptosyltransferase-3
MFKYLSVFSRILINDRPFRKSFFSNVRFLLKQPKSVGSASPSVIIINLTEHMGDIVAAEPVARHLRKANPDAYIIWCVNEKFAEITRHNPALDKTITVTCIAEWILIKKIIASRIRIYDLHLSGRSCGKYKLTNKNSNPYGINIFNYLDRGNLLQMFAKTAGIRDMPDETPQFHLSPAEKDQVTLPFEYVVVHPVANDADRNWNQEGWSELVARLLETNPRLHVVEIGLNPIINNQSHRFHNLTGKYSLQQIACIIRDARMFVGVESGFAHFANALGTNSAVIIGYFKQYKNYMVYSGRFAAGKDCVLHYHPGKLIDMSVDQVWPSINRQLKHGAAARTVKA